MIHIGRIIKDELEKQGISKTQFAELLHTHRSNVYKVFEHSYINTDLLYRISLILDIDFFAFFSEELHYDDHHPINNRQ